MTNVKEAHKKPETLGVAGLALHYANLVTQMDNIVSYSPVYASFFCMIIAIQLNIQCLTIPGISTHLFTS